MSGSPTRDWDASTYDRVSTPQQDWALDVVERLDLRGDETVVDAGCGSGRVTQLLLERLPDGHVIAIDGSESMVAEARVLLGADRTTFVHSDLLDLDLVEAADAVFSNAVFHWVLDHERLFTRLATVLRPGGRLEAQCGGEGNVARFYAAAADVAADRELDELASYSPHRFPGAAETAAILEIAGFEEIECGLVPRPVVPPEPREFIRTVCLGPHLDLLAEAERAPYLDAVLERLGETPELDYVRLNISAKRKSGAAS